METAGPNELGYASAAILTALLQHLIEIDIVSGQAASDILDKAVVSLKGFGNLVFVPGAIRVVGEVRSDLAKKGIS
jgi:hypothetical protein